MPLPTLSRHHFQAAYMVAPLPDFHVDPGATPRVTTGPVHSIGDRGLAW